MKLIVGLGNPGKEYEKTRHNAGFLFVDHLRETWDFPEWKDSKFHWIVSEWIRDGEKYILLKPMTYMNLSGDSVGAIMNFYKISLEDMIVVFDDLDMEFAKVRYREDGSAGGHNGIKSMIARLGTERFARIKIGIGRDPRYSVSDWVLSKFTDEELKNLREEVFERTVEMFEKFLKPQRNAIYFDKK